MKDKKKLIILSSIILGVLVLTLGLTYAAFTYNKTGETSELVLGDIWMKYTENNQLTLADAMPMNINNYTTYKVNPVMATQEVNELYVCATYLIGTFADENLDSGSTLATYCQGTGTEGDGYTFQDDLNDDMFNDEQITFLEDNNIIILEEDGSYTVNPIMATQEVTDNELSRCVNFYQGYEFDEESTVESFCKGTGTAFGGLTIQETLDNWIADAEEYDFDFLEDGGQELLDAGVILPKIENLPYFEFTISGKNTYTKEDIWYDIVLTHGDEHETRTTRIRDNLLRFALSKVEGESETILLNNKSYSDLNNKRIWVETINANTTSVVNNTYRLYMWIGEDTVIGNVNQDYTIEEWNDVFASIKVGVTGDFVEKIITTDENCFNAVKRIGNFTLNTTEEAVSKCIDYVSSIKRDENFSSENTIEDYCRGNGVRKNYHTNYYTGDFTIKEDILFDTKNASRVTQPFFNSTHIQYFIDEHIIEDVEYVVQLISYDNTCGPNVIIPKEIAGYPVTMLGHDALMEDETFLEHLTNNSVANSGFYLPYFLGDGNYTKVVIPNTVNKIISTIFVNAEIDEIEFEENIQIEALGNINKGLFFGDSYLATDLITNNLKLPNSVIKLASGAIGSSSVNELILGNKIRYIDEFAFNNSQINKLTIDKTCNEIKNIQASETDTTLYYPWGISSIYGSGGEVCETN